MAMERDAVDEHGNPLDGWLRLAEAAELAGVSRSTLHRASFREEDGLRAAWMPFGRLFERENVVAFAERRRRRIEGEVLA